MSDAIHHFVAEAMDAAVRRSSAIDDQGEVRKCGADMTLPHRSCLSIMMFDGEWRCFVKGSFFRSPPFRESW